MYPPLTVPSLIARRSTILFRRILRHLLATGLVVLPADAAGQTISARMRALSATQPRVVSVCQEHEPQCIARIYTLAGVRNTLTLVVVRLPASGVRMTVRYGPALPGQAVSLYDAVTRSGDVVVMSGGYQDDDAGTRPHHRIGLLISGGHKESGDTLAVLRTSARNINASVGGVVFDRGRGPEIVPLGAFRETPDVLDAVQTLPILVRAGRNADVRDQRTSNRVAIARTADGGTLVAGVFGSRDKAPITTAEWADFLAAPTAAGGLGATSALQVESGPPGHIYLPHARLHFGSNSMGWIPSTLHLWLGGKNQ